MLVGDPHKLCRLCLTSTELIDIFSATSTDLSPSVVERINLCLPVKVYWSDTFPTKLCLPCLENVNKFYTFWLQTESSQKRLQELFGSESIIVQSDENGHAGKNLTPDLLERNPQVPTSCEGDEPAFSCPSSPLKDSVSSNKTSAFPKKTSENEGMAICTSCSVHRNDSNLQLSSSVETPCCVCNQPVNTKPRRDCRKYVCSVCDYSNTSLSNFKIHMLKHNSEHLAYCRYCNKGFYSRAACTEHEQVKHDGKSVSCELCSKSYHSKAYLKLHVKTHHPDFKNDGFQCDLCGQMFKSSKSVKRHNLADHMGRLYRCDVCDKEMKSLDSLKNHLKIHRGEKHHVCLSCGKAFRTKNGLSVHERIHSGSRPFKCQICGSSFTQSSSLKIHVRYHKGDRPFQCCDCNKGFVTLTLLKMHQFKHHDPARNCSSLL